MCLAAACVATAPIPDRLPIGKCFRVFSVFPERLNRRCVSLCDALTFSFHCSLFDLGCLSLHVLVGFFSWTAMLF